MPKSTSKEDAEVRYREWLERKSQEEEAHKARIARYAMREKALKELRSWLKERGLERHDLLLMYHDMAPKRADEPVKSRKPLHPAVKAIRQNKHHNTLFGSGQHAPKGGKDYAAFRAAIREARIAKGWTLHEAAAMAGVSHGAIQNWESGRNVITDANRLLVLKAYGLPLDLGKAASSEMETSRKEAQVAGLRANGLTTDPA